MPAVAQINSSVYSRVINPCYHFTWPLSVLFKLHRLADLEEGLKAWSKPFLLSLPHNCSHENEKAWIIIQNNDSFQRRTCCVDCITSTGYDTIFKHSPSVIYVFTKSCFQLEDVTLPLKHIYSSHHTKPLLLRCLCILRCKASITFLAVVQPNGEVTQCALLLSQPTMVGKILHFPGVSHLKIAFQAQTHFNHTLAPSKQR